MGKIFSINITAIRKFVEVKAFYEEKGNFISFGSDVAFEALKLREEMYKLSPEKRSLVFGISHN
ncbi:hypothetical protein CCAN12_720037 [Capnocytophaga canimorsus]|uniref:Uncharacterized protein n=1 Tax=Capnocytophaga canimorsus TaxID=28188 RepID=A0A0B7HKJ5_9FLAO|nr:hypothetical protein [Capnocytophaga canimorsus]CEN38058.1 hypothetical protein CCAN12_720037 [Capnocytophaga canimorsus]